MIEVEFSYKQQNINFQCELNSKIEDIYKRFITKVDIDINSIKFFYLGSQINNDKLTIEELINSNDRLINKMKILVEPIYELTKEKSIIKSNDIICPKCHEKAKINIKDYNINIFGCKNNHTINNISLDNYENSQMIDISNIICGKCKINKYNDSDEKIFYYCLNCKMNLCDACKIEHEKNHNIIDYNNIDYICNTHNKAYTRFCEECKLNICLLCERQHNNHKTIKIKPNLDLIKDNMKKLREKLNILNNNLENIIKKLKKVMDNFEIYYRIYNHIYNNYEKKKRNYELYYNLREININDIINDIEKINNEFNNSSKIRYILNIYNKMKNNELNNNEINIIYEVKDNKYIRIFGNEFVNHNKYKCQIILEDKEHEINTHLNIPSHYKKDKISIKLTGINDINNISCLFYECSSLYSVPDISRWNTSNVINMSYLFGNCSSLTYLPDISNWNTSNVKYMQGIFMGCKSLKSLPDISKWDTSNVIIMGGIFRNLTSLSPMSIQKSKEYIENGKYYYRAGLFYNCISLTSLPDISNWNTKNAKDISQMFSRCESLEFLPDISKWNTNKVVNISGLFYGCLSLISLPDISKWNTSNVLDMSEMFTRCYELSSLPDISKWNTSNVTDISEMFYRCLVKPKIICLKFLSKTFFISEISISKEGFFKVYI